MANIKKKKEKIKKKKQATLCPKCYLGADFRLVFKREKETGNKEPETAWPKILPLSTAELLLLTHPVIISLVRQSEIFPS